MKILFLFLAGLLIFSSQVFAMDTQEAVPITEAASPSAYQDKEYNEATVLLVDHDSGMLGVKMVDEETGKESKFSFKVDPDDINVTNNINQYLEFSDIQVGDMLDIYSEVDKNGKETVTDIIDYSQIEKE